MTLKPVPVHFPASPASGPSGFAAAAGSVVPAGVVSSIGGRGPKTKSATDSMIPPFNELEPEELTEPVKRYFPLSISMVSRRRLTCNDPIQGYGRQRCRGSKVRPQADGDGRVRRSYQECLRSGTDGELRANPLATESGRPNVASYVDDALGKGATALLGGECPDGIGWALASHFYRRQ